MISDPWLSWALVFLFALAAAYCAWQLLRPGPLRSGMWRGKISHLLHLLMCLSMLAMIRPGTPTVPYPAQILVFAVGTVWFAAMALRRGARAGDSTGFSCATSRTTVWYHTAMMAAMLWMVVVMAGPLVGPAQRAEASPHAGHAHAGMDMPGMDMPSAGAAHHTTPAGTAVVAVALGLLFLVAALWWLRRYFELRKNGGRASLLEAELICETAMALGMGVAILAMA